MAVYVKNLKINSYRGIKNLELNDFNNINIFTGGNNSGKTSLLEILKSLNSPLSLKTWIDLTRRGPFYRVDKSESLKELFDIDSDKNISFEFETLKKKSNKVEVRIEEEEVELVKPIKKVKAKQKDIDEYELEEYEERIIKVLNVKMKYNNEKNKDKIDPSERRIIYKKYQDKKNQTISTEYLSPFAHLENRIYLKDILNDVRLYKEMLDVLKEFDEDIISINADNSDDIFSSGTYKILSSYHKKAISLNSYGDGMKKAILLMSAVIHSIGGILLIDEIETAIHTSGMRRTFKWILDASKKLNVQLFLTSHSDEAIEKILTCSDDLKKDINLYTLYKKKEKTVARKFTADEAIEARNLYGLELR